MFIAFILIISMSVLIPLRAQMLLGAQADAAALLLLPFSLGIPVGAYIGGKLSPTSADQTHSALRRIGVAGHVGVGLHRHSRHGLEPILRRRFIGISIGVQLPTATVAAQNAVAQRHVGIVTAVIVFCRSLGAAIGIAVLMAVLMATLHNLAPAA